MQSRSARISPLYESEFLNEREGKPLDFRLWSDDIDPLLTL